MIFCLASAVGRPSRESTALCELIAVPSPGVQTSVAMPSPMGAVFTTGRMGRSNFFANSQSRSSCAGTAMIAPVP